MVVLHREGGGWVSGGFTQGGWWVGEWWFYTGRVVVAGG